MQPSRPVGLFATVLFAALLGGCTQLERIAPTVQGVARPNGTAAAALPMPVCDTPVAGGTIGLSILGSGFVGELVDAIGPARSYFAPRVLLEGPQTSYSGLNERLTSGERLDVDLDQAALDGGAPALIDGLYSVTVMNPDEYHDHLQAHSTLTNAVQILPPPTVTSVTPSTICLNNPATVIFRGGPFSAGLQMRSLYGFSLGQSSIQVDAPDQAAATFAKGLVMSEPLDLVFDDPAGCSVRTAVTVACP